MSSIRTAVQLSDAMSGPLMRITNALNMTISSFERMQNVADNSLNTSNFDDVRSEIARANVELDQMTANIQESKNAQEKMNNSVKSGTTAMDGLSTRVLGMVSAYAALQGLAKVVNLSDAYTSTNARLNLMNDGLQTTEQLQNAVFLSAQRSRTAYDATVSSVAKLGVLAGKSFENNKEIIAFTELMNKNFKVGGASITEQTSAMYQLTQAMAAGKLQGDEYRSIIENAPLLASAIEDYMINVQGATGSMKEWASEGLLTADVIKAAMFSSSDQINARFKEIPMTWADVWTSVTNRIYMASLPLLELISTIAQNWATIEPIVVGVTAAVGAYIAALILMKNWQTIVAIGTVLYNAALFIAAIATGNLTLAQTALNVVLNACPLILIATLIGMVIMWIYKWVQSVGGFKIAWMMAMDVIMTAWDYLLYGLTVGGNWILNLLAKMQIGWYTAVVAIAGFVGDMKVNVLTFLEKMINGAIDLLNDFIGLLNKIPGVNIEAVGSVQFATEAALENEAKKQALNDALVTKTSEIQAEIDARNNLADKMLMDAQTAHADRQAAIAAKQAEAQLVATEESVSATAAVAENTGNMADSMEITSEDLKYLRDIAEQETINRFTTAEIRIEQTNHNTIASGMDIDGVVDQLTIGVNEAMEKAAEGVHS